MITIKLVAKKKHNTRSPRPALVVVLLKIENSKLNLARPFIYAATTPLRKGLELRISAASFGRHSSIFDYSNS